MAYTIAVAGKGGTGKTTLAALICRALLKYNLTPVLCVDADPNSNLNESLGVNFNETIGDLIEEVLGADKTLPGGMSKEQYIEHRMEDLLKESKGFDLLVMGWRESPGCFCYANELLRRHLNDLAGKYPYTVIDNEAGLEHLSRRTTRNADLFFIVSDPSLVGIHSAGRVLALAKKLKLGIKKTYLVINRAEESLPEVIQKEIEKQGLTLTGTIPQDEMILEFEFQAKSRLSLPDENKAAQAVEKILSKCGVINRSR